MTAARSDQSLSGTLLAATTRLDDTPFRRALILCCEHGPAGAMGLMVNRPCPDLRRRHGLLIHRGGPREPGRAFLLHPPDGAGTGSGEKDSGGDGGLDEEGEKRGQIEELPLPCGLVLSASLGRLEDAVRRGGPERGLLMAGYMDWPAGEIEAGIGRHDWLPVPFSADVVLDLEDARKWEAALGRLGIGPDALAGLSATGGRA